MSSLFRPLRSFIEMSLTASRISSGMFLTVIDFIVACGYKSIYYTYFENA